MSGSIQDRIQRLSEDYDTEIVSRYHSLQPNLVQSKEKLEKPFGRNGRIIDLS
jgi:hypothetical protein